MCRVSKIRSEFTFRCETQQRNGMRCEDEVWGMRARWIALLSLWLRWCNYPLVGARCQLPPADDDTHTHRQNSTSTTRRSIAKRKLELIGRKQKLTKCEITTKKVNRFHSVRVSLSRDRGSVAGDEWYFGILEICSLFTVLRPMVIILMKLYRILYLCRDSRDSISFVLRNEQRLTFVRYTPDHKKSSPFTLSVLRIDRTDILHRFFYIQTHKIQLSWTSACASIVCVCFIAPAIHAGKWLRIVQRTATTLHIHQFTKLNTIKNKRSKNKVLIAFTTYFTVLPIPAHWLQPWPLTSHFVTTHHLTGFPFFSPKIVAG